MLTVANSPGLSIFEFLARGYIRVEANQDSDKVTFASNFMLGLAKEYTQTLVRLKSQLEHTVWFRIVTRVGR